MQQYEQYKDSGVAWLGEVPSHWEIKRLKFSIANISNKIESQMSRLRYFGLENIQSFTGNLLTDIELESEGIANEFQKYDVLFGKLRPYLAKIHLAKQNGLVSTEALVFRSNTGIKPEFLFYFCVSADFIDSVNSTTFGSKMPRASWEDISNFKMLIPPLPEQTAIATYLDSKLGEIDMLISKQETLLEKLAEQRIAIITHTVTKGLNPDVEMKNSGVEWLGEVPSHWEIIKNKFVLEFSKGLTITKENLLDNGIPCVNYGEIHSKYGFEVNPQKHSLKCVSEEYLTTNRNALLQNGDFVFADTSEDVKGSGNFTYLSSDTPTFAGYHTIIARPNKSKVFPRFLAYTFESDRHRNQIRAIVKGVKVFSITQAFLKNTFVWLPPLPEQTAIADYLDEQTTQIDRLSERVQQVIDSLKSYRSALITQAVTGKIKVI